MKCGVRCLALILAWLLAGCGASSVAPQNRGVLSRAPTTSAIRVLPPGYTAGTTITVTIAATPATGAAVYAVEDVVPIGWAASAVDNGGAFDPSSGKVRWGPYFDDAVRSLSYQLAVPADARGDHVFVGTIAADGTSQEILGNAVLKPVSSNHPADTNGDGSIGIAELTAYGKAWKTGATWPVGPNPIPIGYVTNAGYLWKNGEGYVHDPSVEDPLKDPPFAKAPDLAVSLNPTRMDLSGGMLHVIATSYGAASDLVQMTGVLSSSSGSSNFSLSGAGKSRSASLAIEPNFDAAELVYEVTVNASGGNGYTASVTETLRVGGTGATTPGGGPGFPVPPL